MASNYKVLYRKYRPTSFDEIIGQSYTVQMLKNAVINDKISHAYIFTGPRGTGKTSTAKIFAKTINCENAQNGIPCGKCSICQNINNNADIIEIDAASNNGVDEIRELINNVKIAPTFAKYKVYIIDEVHMLSQSAFNALLLTLEEPPQHIVFILATTNIESVPITILSRCQRYEFKKLELQDLINHLKHVSELENIQITDDAIEEIAYLSEGGCRDALSILNQLSTSNAHIDLETVLLNYGSVSNVQIQKIVKSYLNNDYDALKSIFEQIKNSSMDYKIFLKKLIDQLFKEAIIRKKDKQNDIYRNIKNTIFELNDVMNKININVNPFLLIFLILIEYINPIENQSNNEQKNIEENKFLDNHEIIENQKEKSKLLEKNDSLKEQNTLEDEKEKNNNAFNEYINELVKVRVNNCFAEADKNLLKTYKEKWNKFIEKVETTNKIKSIILDSSVVLASLKVNIVVHSQNSMVDLFNHELNDIINEYEIVTEEKINFIALTNEEWEEKKKEYVKRLKEHKTYQILEEPIYNFKQQSENKGEEKLDISNAFTIFDKEKIEIK